MPEIVGTDNTINPSDEVNRSTSSPLVAFIGSHVQGIYEWLTTPIVTHQEGEDVEYPYRRTGRQYPPVLPRITTGPRL